MDFSSSFRLDLCYPVPRSTLTAYCKNHQIPWRHSFRVPSIAVHSRSHLMISLREPSDLVLYNMSQDQCGSRSFEPPHLTLLARNNSLFA